MAETIKKCPHTIIGKYCDVCDPKPTLDEGQTHFVGDDCPGGHQDVRDKFGIKEGEKVYLDLDVVDEPAEHEAEAEEVEEEEIKPRNIWMVVSFYLDAGSTYRDVLKDARTEREVRGENVLIFAHDHDFAYECGKKCRRIE